MSAYDEDILVWSEQQGALLRRMAAGERVNSAELDWLNLAEEIESVGRHELRATESMIVQALAHMLKAAAWPDAVPAARWRVEVENFRDEARRAFAPSMRQRIDMDKLYRRALRWLPPEIDGKPPLAVPPGCPVTLEELLGEE